MLLIYVLLKLNKIVVLYLKKKKKKKNVKRFKRILYIYY